MHNLQIKQILGSENDYQLILLDNDKEVKTAQIYLPSIVKDNDRADMRWYLEDYLQYPIDPAPAIAKRIENRISQIGTELFNAVLLSNEEARLIWDEVEPNLLDTRIEIVTAIEESTNIPWELMHHPMIDEPVAIHTKSFVRSLPKTAKRNKEKKIDSGPLRILLIISRPGAMHDIEYRSISREIINGLKEDYNNWFQLDVLRPPTFTQLAKVLRKAQSIGKPYHLVHFDGHGGFMNLEKIADREMAVRDKRSGEHGYILFENSESKDNIEFIDGTRLGNLLASTSVSILVLNSCRSDAKKFKSEISQLPEESVSIEEARPTAFASLAQEVMYAGVNGVVAMALNIYVVTAAKFVANLYSALSQGQTLGESVTYGRKILFDDPKRDVAFKITELQDWSVPVVYETIPLHLFDVKSRAAQLYSDSNLGHGVMLSNLPGGPELGFIGREEAILALDRAFDTQKIVLLHSPVNTGKTATASEFARWYSLTGGVKGPVLYTSFREYDSVDSVLGSFGLEINHKLNIDVNKFNFANIQYVYQVIDQAKMLWIWDDIEYIFKPAKHNVWNAKDKKNLLDLLRNISNSKTKLLLISDNEEKLFLRHLPFRITLSPLQHMACLQLTKLVSARKGRQPTDIDDINKLRPIFKVANNSPILLIELIDRVIEEKLSVERINDLVDSFATFSKTQDENWLNMDTVNDIDKNDANQKTQKDELATNNNPKPNLVLDYENEKQSWFAGDFPKTKDVEKKDIKVIKGQIEIVIITATDVELRATIALLKPLRMQKKILKLHSDADTYYLGRYGKFNTALTKCEMGSVGPGSAVLATEHAKQTWHPKAIIMVGIAFGKEPPEQNIGDVLVASQIIFYEIQKKKKGKLINRGMIPPSNQTLLNRFENALDWQFSRPDGKMCKYFVGPILSGEKLVNDLEFKSILFDQFPQAIGGEMEGAGLAAAAIRSSTAWILVKSICDWADGTKNDKYQPLAAASAASFVYHVLSEKTVLDGIPKHGRTMMI